MPPSVKASDFDLILYHDNCPDGLTAAWCFWRYNRDIECIGMRYNTPPPDVRGRRVAIVDFSFPRSVLEQMKQDATVLRVWDHHETARDSLNGLPYCTFDMSKAGCELTLEALEGDIPMPYFVKANADHDVWRKIPDSEAISRYLREHRGNTFANYDRLYSTPSQEYELLTEGRRLISQDMEAIKRQLKLSRLYKLKGTEYIVRIGIPPANLYSEFGEAMCLEGGCDFSITYRYVMENFEWRLSARSVGKEVNVSKIMKEHFDGGGHFNASGATLHEAKGQIPSLYFELLQ